MFGIIKSALGFRQFLLRGLDNVRGEWSLVTMAYNVKRLFARNCSPPFQRDHAATGMMGLAARALVMACSAVRPCRRPVAITEAAAA